MYLDFFSQKLDINLDISFGTTATLLASETKYQYIRCIAPSYRSAGDLVLAVGLANGKVGLCNFGSSTENSIDFSEFTLRQIHSFSTTKLVLTNNLPSYKQLQSNQGHAFACHGTKMKRIY